MRPTVCPTVPWLSPRRPWASLALAVSAALAVARPAEAASACTARSPATVPAVVELYTSEGAGENRGATLRQDGVVRELLPWTVTGAMPAPLRFASTAPPEPGSTRHWVAVATDGAHGRPLQAVRLACPG